MDWYLRCAYSAEQKQAFHAAARKVLRHLAAELGFAKGTFDLRSNSGGIAVSGEITLHHERIYVQVSQPATGADSGILIRTCNGRRDYVGGRNHFAPLSRLEDVRALARTVKSVMASGQHSCSGIEEERGREGVSRPDARESSPPVRPATLSDGDLHE